MKNSLLCFLVFIFSFFNLHLIAQELEINSSKVTYDNIKKVTIFEGNVSSKDEKGNEILSEYAKYDKLKNIIETNGETKIITSGGYQVFGSNVVLDDNKKIIYSNNKTRILDEDGNSVFVEMFNYSILTNIFFFKRKN
jgi:lipopolysaccharide assembly outer membrane protein LptD (OstA)